MITTNTFVGEIESLRTEQEQQQQQQQTQEEDRARGSLGFQLVFVCLLGYLPRGAPKRRALPRGVHALAVTQCAGLNTLESVIGLSIL